MEDKNLLTEVVDEIGALILLFLSGFEIAGAIYLKHSLRVTWSNYYPGDQLEKLKSTEMRDYFHKLNNELSRIVHRKERGPKTIISILSPGHILENIKNSMDVIIALLLFRFHYLRRKDRNSLINLLQMAKKHSLELTKKCLVELLKA